MQEYELGKYIRNRYKDFLSPTYSPDEVYIRSTDVDRTLMSAESNLAGLYPPVESQEWNHELKWQPIPIHTIPENEDEVSYLLILILFVCGQGQKESFCMKTLVYNHGN